jgi:hypothetical protein
MAQIEGTETTINIGDTDGGASTELATQAGTMVPGELRSVTTAFNFDEDYVLPNWQGDKESPLTEFSDNLVWDPINHIARLYGCARGNDGPAHTPPDDDYECGGGADWDAGAWHYRETTNDWVQDTTHPLSTNPHAYAHATINPATGTYYYWESIACDSMDQNNCQVNVQTTPGGSWTTITRPGLGGPGGVGAETGSLIYFPERTSLVWFDGGNDNARPFGGSSFFPRVIEKVLPAGSWNATTITTDNNQMPGYASLVAKYSPQHALIYFGGGDAIQSGAYTGNGPTKLWMMLADGSLVQGEDTPAFGFEFGATAGKSVVDPCTGDLLVFDNTPKNIWRFDPDADADGTWTNEDTHTLTTSGSNEMRAVFASIPEYDVIMIVNYNGTEMYLYQPESC